MTTQRGMMAVATVALLVGFATGGVLGRQSAEADVKAMHDIYYQYFADGQAGAIADEIYHPNRIRFGADGATLATGRDDIEAGMRQAIDGLVAQGYDHSEMMTPSICAPNPGTVIVSGGIRRYHDDGSVLGELGASYIYGQTEDGWRIHAVIGHDPTTAVGCVK